MIYRKMIKNVLLSQYYENCEKVNEYFNRKVPIAISMLLTVLCQISGGMLLTLFGIAASSFIDGKFIYIYFMFIAWIQSLLQARRDYDMYKSIYDKSIFIYGYNNKTSILSNGLAYGILNIISNPMVFIPYFVFPAFWYRNVLQAVFNLIVPVFIYLVVFLKKNNRNYVTKNNGLVGEAMYIIKTIAVVVLMMYLMKFFFETKVNALDQIEKISGQISVEMNKILNIFMFWLPTAISIVAGIYVFLELGRTNSFCCEVFGEKNETIISGWVYRLSQKCKDAKVRSDLKIIARRRDIWKDNANLAFLLPNTVVLIAILMQYIFSKTNIGIDSLSFLIAAVLFESVVIVNFIFKNMSFMMFHNSELENINLYKMRKKDTGWLLYKKLKLICWLAFPASLFTTVVFCGLGLYWMKSILCLILIPITIASTILTAFVTVYWMHSYRHKYVTYEEFSTKKISLSMKSQLTSILYILMSLPFILYLFDSFVGKLIISNEQIMHVLVIIVVFSIGFSGIGCLVSIKKWKK